MSKELLDVVDEAGNPIAAASREEIHKKGLLHREIHIWLFTSNGEIIFQHRSKNKDACPDMLDASVGGHVDPGMDFESTALKELEEETGIQAKPADLVLVGTVHTSNYDPVTDMTNNALRYEYALRYDEPIGNLQVEAVDGSGFEVWPIDTLLNMPAEKREKFIPLMLEDVYLDIYRAIKKLLQK